MRPEKINPNEKTVKTENDGPRDPRQKYLNQTQLLQGVAQVEDPRLDQAERLFLFALASFQVRTFPSPANYPHPGNKILMTACGVTSRQAVNKIVRRLLDKKLIEVVAFAKGGHGMATVFRICTEDPRFPSPKPKEPSTVELSVPVEQPSTLEDPVAESTDNLHLPDRQPDPGQPSTGARQPSTVELHPDSNAVYIPNISANKSAPDPSDRLYLEKLKKLSESVTDALVHRMLGDDNFEPDYFGDIRKLFQSEADDLAVDYKDFQNLYRGSMRTAEWVVTPAELVGPGPITEELIEKWAADAASNPDVLEIIRDGGTALTLVFANGIEEHYIGHDEPYWFPFDDVPLQETNAGKEPVVAHAMPDVPEVPA